MRPLTDGGLPHPGGAFRFNGRFIIYGWYPYYLYY